MKYEEHSINILILVFSDPKREVQVQPIQTEPKGNGELYFILFVILDILCILNCCYNYAANCMSKHELPYLCADSITC